MGTHCTAENTAKNFKTSAGSAVGDRVFKADLETPSALHTAPQNTHNSAKILLLGPQVLWKLGRCICKGWASHPNQMATSDNVPAQPSIPSPTLLVSFFLAVSSARSSSVGGPSIVPCSKVSRSISLSSFMLWVNLLEGQRVGQMVRPLCLHDGKAWGWLSSASPTGS